MTVLVALLSFVAGWFTCVIFGGPKMVEGMLSRVLVWLAKNSLTGPLVFPRLLRNLDPQAFDEFLVSYYKALKQGRNTWDVPVVKAECCRRSLPSDAEKIDFMVQKYARHKVHG